MTGFSFLNVEALLAIEASGNESELKPYRRCLKIDPHLDGHFWA